MLVKHGMNRNNILIGLTGGSGSGKSVVARAAVDLGFTHIDADHIGHDIILKPEKAYYKIIDFFGMDILNDDGEIDRRKLGSIVFKDNAKLELLSNITHPLITEKVLGMINGNAIIDGAVLHKTPDLINRCDYVISVINSDERRAEFICRRDGIDISSALERIHSQPDNKFYSDIADFVIYSDCDIDELYKKSLDVIKRCIGD